MSAYPAQYIKDVPCPYQCGWKRGYTDYPTWRHSKIYHPLYGQVTQQQLVVIEIENHKCQQYLDAVARLKARREEIERVERIYNATMALPYP